MQELFESFVEKNTLADTAVRSATGILNFSEGVYFVTTDDGENFPLDGALPAGYKESDRVAVVISNGVAKLTERFGSITDVEANVKAMLRRSGLDTPFEADAIMQAKETTFTEITAHMADRTDLRGKTIITLSESENSRNECGFSVELDKDGNYILGIHTTDVAEFVPAGTALEREVLSRAKTAMLPGKEIPMLPEQLTKGPCFLEVGEDRLAISYFLTIDEEGNVTSFDFCESVIKTAANCLFSEIEALFLDYDTSAIMPLRLAYASILPTIGNMFNLGAALQSARVIRGGADIDKAERHFLYNRHSTKPVGVVFRKDSDPKRLVREFLSVAGQQLAAYFYKNDIPAIYRVQAKPEKASFDKFRRHAELLGVDTSSFSDDELFGGVAESIRGIREEELLLTELRSLLPEATFAAQPEKHFIHNSEMYTRFAYPLNRCADFCTQRIVKAALSGYNDKAKLKENVALVIEAVKAESKINACEAYAEDLTAIDCLMREPFKAYGGLVMSVNPAGATILLDNGCIAELDIQEQLTEKDIEIDLENEKIKINGTTYGYGDEITVRIVCPLQQFATLYVEA